MCDTKKSEIIGIDNIVCKGIINAESKNIGVNNIIYPNVIICPSAKIGNNNAIHSNVIIHSNVKIGNNNMIYGNVTLCPNTIIGDNNIIYNNNVIGEYPIQANGSFQDYDFDKTKPVIIGNNNFFHVRNIIFCGTEKNTVIGNNNKILCDCHVNHDCYIGNHVTLYPRVTLCGFVKCLDYCNIGGSSFIHQHKTIGQYTMIGANNFVGKNVFPYFIYINNAITRLNDTKIPNYAKKNENIIKKIVLDYYGSKNFKINELELELEIQHDITTFLSEILKT